MDRTTISVHLGQGKTGKSRKAALNRIARRNGHEWGGEPSIGRWLTALANEEAEMQIRIEFSEDSLFGDMDPETEEIDVDASIAQFIEMLEAKLREDYTDFQVVQCIHNRVMVNGMDDHDEVPWVEQAMEQVWSSWDWLVSK